MGEIRVLWILPLVTSIFGVLGILLPAVIGVANGDLQAILPFISDGGAFAPEKSIFSLLLNIDAVLLAILAYIKHLHFVTFYHKRRSDSFWRYLSIITMLDGFVASFGQSLVGNFSEMDVHSVHDASASITFTAGVIYLLLTTGLSFLRPLLCSPLIAWLRVALASIATVTVIFHTVVLESNLFFAPGTNITAYDGDTKPIFLDPDSPYFVHHTVVTSTEWLLGFSLFAYFTTFVDEFRKSTLTLPSIHFNVDRAPFVDRRRSSTMDSLG